MPRIPKLSPLEALLKQQRLVCRDAQSTNDPLDPSESKVRVIVNRSYVRSCGSSSWAGQQHRPLTVTAIPGTDQKPSHVAIAISGFSCYGLVIVDLENVHELAVDYMSLRHLNKRETKLLRSYALKIQTQIANENGISNTWSWSSASVKTKAKAAF